MPELNTVTPEGTQATPNATPANENILSRVANFKPEETKPKGNEEFTFNPQDFDKIESVEEAKKYAENAYKSLEKGYQKKYQDIAELKKALEANVTNSSSWTTERVQSLLQDQSFVSAAQGVLGQANPAQDDNEYSALSESEKRKISAIEKQNHLLLQQQNMLLMKQQDEMLKQKYPNYDQGAVDTITADLLQGKVNNTREYIWRAKDYEDAVNRAYQLGMQDARGTYNENIQSASFTGGEAIPSTPVKKEKGESNESLLKRLYSSALRNSRGMPK